MSYFRIFYREIYFILFLSVSGSVDRRWKSFQPGNRCEVSIALRANSIKHEQKRLAIDQRQLVEQMLSAEMEWQEELIRLGELGIRDHILESICPEIRGMNPIKLAMALVISSSGIENSTATSCGLGKRGQSHLLLIGDPGVAKSRLLMRAASIAPRVVQTTGMGCSSAGLTAAAIKVRYFH